MIDRKYPGSGGEGRRRSPSLRYGDVYDPIENDLGVAFVVVVSVALFMMAQDSVADVWTGISACLDQTLRIAGS